MGGAESGCDRDILSLFYWTSGGMTGRLKAESSEGHSRVWQLTLTVVWDVAGKPPCGLPYSCSSSLQYGDQVPKVSVPRENWVKAVSTFLT